MKSQDISINIDNVTKCYQKSKGISNVTTRFEGGYLNLLTGENGSGKTTLFKCIMGLVKYNGSIKRNTSRIGYAPEQFVMPAFMTVSDFLQCIGRVKNQTKQSVSPYLDENIAFYDLKDSYHKPIGALSNGMKQKVNLLQSMIHQPRILLLDEPLTALDKKSQTQVIETIKDMSKKNLVIVSTHYPELFKYRNKRIYQIENGIMVKNGYD